MWLGKLSLKAAALVLVGAVSSMAQGLAPLTFGNTSTDARNWNYLINYKMWGQTAISFGNNNNFPKADGWVGSATGNLSATGNDAKIAGAIVVGGSVNNDRGMTLTTGPVRYGGSISNSGKASGTKCQGTTTSGSCADVPQYRDIPVPYMSAGGWPSNLRDLNTPDHGTYTIDARSGSADLYFNNINFGQESRLLVLMPAGGRTTRIFAKKFNISQNSTHPQIVVQYDGESGPRCNLAPGQQSNSKYNCSGGDYEGNLVIYVEQGFTLQNIDYAPFVGTIISGGTLEVVCNMSFAGQLIAKNLKMGNEVKGDGFKFVPPEEIPELVLSNKSATFKEDNTWHTINIGLDKAGEEDVTFKYCFEFRDPPVNGQYASKDDVAPKDASHAFPICGTDSPVQLTIPKGDVTPTASINLKPLIDGLVETSTSGEKFWLVISDLKGAKTSTDNFDSQHNGFNIYITDSDELPYVTSALVINVNEDEKHAFTSTEFNYKHSTRTFASVTITSLPAKGTLTLNGTAISSGANIAVADLGKLTYQAKANEFGNSYTTFKYKVVGSGTGDNTSVEYTATVNVAPVNDKPVVDDVNFQVNELDHIVSGGPITVSDVSNEINVDKYTYALDATSTDYSAFNSVFEIVPSGKGQTATIKVKSGAVLDYSVKKEYVVYATVKDDAATETSVVNGPLTSNKFKITVKIKNENDPPVIANQSFTIPEKNTDGSDWTSAKVVGNVVATDPDGDGLQFKVVDSGIPFAFRNSSEELYVSDGSALDFETKPTWTFKVSVTDGDLSATATITVTLTDVNEPPSPPVVKREYSVEENKAKGTVVGTFEVFDGDKISGSYETLTYTLEGALTGAAAASTTLKNKTMADIFELVETNNNAGTRTVSIRVKDQALLDYESLYNGSNATYPVNITVTDSKGHSTDPVSTRIAVIDVNETLTATGGTFHLEEHLPIGSPVCADYADLAPGAIFRDCKKQAQVVGSDLDIYNPAFSDLTFTMSSTKNTGSYAADAKSFTIGKKDGKLYSNAEFDHETGQLAFEFYVNVSDGDFSVDVLVTIDIDNIKEPEIISHVDGAASIKENSATGTKVENFKENADVQKSIEDAKLVSDIVFKVDQTASSNAMDLFNIGAEKGIISVKKKDDLDFEKLYPNNLFEVVILVNGKKADGNELSEPIKITRNIQVEDVNEAPVINNAAPIQVPETATKADGPIGYVDATDPDFCSKDPLNACPNGLHPQGFNKLTYTIVEIYDVNGSKDFPFEMDPNTGAISVIDGKTLSATKQDTYKFKAKVMDNAVGTPSKYDEADIIIKVTDVNRPSEFRVLSDLYDIDENVPVSSPFDGKIVVYDEDKADIDALTIDIKDNDASTVAAEDLFEVVQLGSTDAKLLTTFVIKTKKGLDYEELYKATEKDAIFNVTLTINDGSGKPTSKTTQIRVNDVNEEPSFKKDSYEFKVQENTTVATSLGVAEASDPDKYNPSFGTLYYSLDGADAAQFDINTNTGEISTISNAKLDYETKSVYNFYAVVTDKKFTVKVPVTVKIDDVAEVPKFPDNPPPLAVDENTKKGTTVGVVVAEDDDCKGTYSATCKTPKYSLTATSIAADDYKSFTIDADGTIKVAQDSILNYEVKKEYSVRVVATDGSDPTLSSYIDVTIKINDVNDAPTYEKKEFVFEIHENAPKGEFIGTVVADDEDTWSVIKYELSDYTSNSGDAATFYIDDDGSIYLATKTLNYEKKKEYKVVATATDNGKDKGFENYQATTPVTIKIIDDPDKPKIKDDGKKGYDVAENTAEQPLKPEIACYELEDEDVGQTATMLGYIKDDGNTKDADRLFDAKVEKKGNVYNLCLSVKNPSQIDYENMSHSYSIIVGVMDADGLTAEVSKTINIVDVNEMPIIWGSTTFSFYDGNKAGNVIGRLDPADVDTAMVFMDNVFAAVGGDTDDLDITEDGKIKTKRVFDFQKDTKHTYELVVSLSDRDNKKYPELTTKTTITVTLKNKPKAPEITSTEFKVKENSDEGTSIGIIEAKDPDGDDDKLLYELTEDNPYVTVTQSGEIKVKDGAEIDYEKMQEFTISVTVKDIDGLETPGDIVIKVVDENEAPKITPQEFTFPEDSKPGTKKGPIEADDPDKKNPKFNDLKFYPVEENEKFEIKENGDIVLKGELDYETEKSYVVKVYVTDGEFTDTTDITINVGNVVEKSEVKITRVEAGDSVYLNPTKDKPIYTNKEVILVEWKQDGKTKSSLDTLKEGCQQIIKSFKDSSKDIAGADTIEVCYSTAAPVVDVFAPKTKVTADNIFTVVEEVDKKDSSIYVNDKEKDVKVSVKDTVSGYTETFDVTVVLDTVAVSDKVVKTLIDVAKSQPSLDKDPKSGVSTTPVNDNKTVVSYKKTVNGTDIVISYNVDNDGDIIKVPVIDENGQKKMTEVIEVSTTVEVKGKTVVVSYKADAETGKMLYGDSEGNLMVDVPSSSSSKPTSSSSKKGDSSSSSKKNDSKDSDEVDLKTGVGAFTVTYDAKGVEGNKATVSYVIDEKGKIVANDEGDRGYLVTYTYTNKYGNSADKSVFMVLDKVKPFVKILSPSENDVVYANYVDVDWCISIDGDKDNCVKQDTLNFESLHKGVNTIKRIYRDKAGNEMVAEVSVMMKKAKDVNIDLEKPMILVSIDSVDKYYSSNPPEEDQSYAVSILNPTTHKEKEVVKGFDGDTKKGSGDEPYPGYDGHIGPTLKIDLKLPVATSVGGLATLDDIIINGDMVVLDEVDAADAKKMDVKEYVKEYCSDEFQKEFKSLKDYSKATLYESKAHVKLWFYTTGGQFIDKFSFDYDVDDPDFVDKAGLVKLFFEMKPDMNGELRDTRGRLYGTGPFIVKTNVDIRSKLRCVVPPINENSNKIGDVLKSSDELLTRFGYRRPVLHGNERPLQNTKKSSSKSSSKSSKKK